MEIKKMWTNFKHPSCDKCTKDCGRYQYDNLCSNINYLRNYGQEYYERMERSFKELKKLCVDKLIVYSFGCGCSLDYLAAKQVFGEQITYFNVDECEWAIKQTKEYKQMDKKMPKDNLHFEEGCQLLKLTLDSSVVCFFNSLSDILTNQKNAKNDFISALGHRQIFYILCNFTRGGNHTLAWREECFLEDLCKELSKNYHTKRFEILGGEGIIISGERR